VMRNLAANMQMLIVILMTCVTLTPVISLLGVCPQPRCVMMTTFALTTVVMKKLVLATTHLLTVMTITCARMTAAVNQVVCVQMLTLIVMMTMPAQQTAAILTLDVLMSK
jgi:hypothetical protein